GLIRDNLVKQEWRGYEVVTGVVSLVYDHHRRELLNTLTDIQHDFQDMIISSQHVHMDHDNCLETIIVKGKPKAIEELSHRLKASKGVKHGALMMATTGKDLT
ncbi:MAG: nickel-responsive transcriptional regulator NikR, partial [Candidatus Omnitrophota bacterium]